MKYFQLSFDLEIENKWYLVDILDDDKNPVISRNYLHGAPIEYKGCNIVVYPNVYGKAVDFTYTAFGIPIVSKYLADVISMFGKNAIQRLPVRIAPNIMGYEILNVTKIIDCLDYEKSTIETYEDNVSNPQSKENIRSVYNLTIKTELTESNHIFRLPEWGIVIIISEMLKLALEEAKFTGIKFIPV